jgi:hypothetical protein
MAEQALDFVTLADLELPQDLDDCTLWHRCQHEGWTLFSDNRNEDGENSLQATLDDSRHPGLIPILTLANKVKFEHDPDYAMQVAIDLAELVFGIAEGEYRDRPRIYVPLHSLRK